MPYVKSCKRTRAGMNGISFCCLLVFDHSKMVSTSRSVTLHSTNTHQDTPTETDAALSVEQALAPVGRRCGLPRSIKAITQVQSTQRCSARTESRRNFAQQILGARGLRREVFHSGCPLALQQTKGERPTHSIRYTQQTGLLKRRVWGSSSMHGKAVRRNAWIRRAAACL